MSTTRKPSARLLKLAEGGRMTPQQYRDSASEHEEQAALVQRARLAIGRYPGIGLLFAIPNGGYRPKHVAQLLQDEGVTAGVPDLFLPVARCGYYGLFIELKHPGDGAKLSEEQERVQASLEAQGYAVVSTWGQDAAWAVLTHYMEGRLSFLLAYPDRKEAGTA